MHIAPANPANEPAHDTPPDVPVGTSRPVVMSRGGCAASVPISVAQVSAVDAAIAPAAGGSQAADG